MRTRNLTIDIAKGLGILLVVFGHNWITIANKQELFRVIFSFHVPLFFFLAGIFVKSQEPIKPFIYSKADALLKPYCVVLIAVAFLVVPQRSSSWLDYFAGMMYGVGGTVEWSPLWFLPQLFLSLVFTRIILNWMSNPKILMLTCLVLLGIGVSILDDFWKMPLPPEMNFQLGKSKYIPGLPWSIDLLGINTAFLLLGYVMRDKVLNAECKPLHLVGALVVFSLCHVFFNETIDLNERLYGSFVVTTLQAFLGIYIIISVSVVLNTIPLVAKWLAYIGASSLFILIFHAALQRKVFETLLDILHSPYTSAWIAFPIAVVIPLVTLEIVKRQKHLSLLLLPSKLKKN